MPLLLTFQTGHVSLGTGTSFSKATTTGASTLNVSSIPINATAGGNASNARNIDGIGNLPSIIANATAGSQSSTNSGPPTAGPAFGTTSVGFRSGNSTPTGGHRRSPVSDGGTKNQGVNNRDDKNTRNYNNNRDMRYRDGPRDNFRDGSRGGMGNRGGSFNRQGPMQFPSRRPIAGPPGNFSSRPMNIRMNNTNNNNMRGRLGPPQMMGQPRQMRFRPPTGRSIPNRPNGKLAVKLDPDFDFEKANKEFEELENKLSKVELDGETSEDKEEEHSTSSKDQATEKKEQDDSVFYDKTKSFFDQISCESLQRSKG